MSSFTRRPFNMGNTENPVHSQPEIRGATPKDSDGSFAALTAVLPAEIAIETEDLATAGGISAVFSEDGSMTHVLAQINSALSGYATAEEYEGCLIIRSAGSGHDSSYSSSMEERAYVRIMPPVSGYADAADILGFPSHPNLAATVAAGDLLDAPARPLQQGNPPGTKFLAAGEDRIGTSFNRALHAMGRNEDQLYTWLKKPVARLLDVEVDETTWASFIDSSADGTIDQINVSGGLALLSLESRIFVGGLSKASTLEEIAEMFGVVDNDHNELMSGEDIVRIGAVTRGERGIARPVFADTISAPSPTLSDTTGVPVDGKNALGVDRVKEASTQITGVRQNTSIICSSATFETNEVAPGDIATITGASIDTPFNHNGEYVVEVVVSETELVLRPHHDSASVRELNPDDGGNFGFVTVRAGGEWETDIWVTFEPPLPRFPTNGKIRLVLPYETTLADLGPEDFTASTVRVYDEADGWVMYNLWQQLSMGGAYQGQNHDNGGGYRGEVTHRPITLVNAREGGSNGGSLVRSSTGAATLATDTLRLTAASTDSFTPADVGRTIFLNAATMLTLEHWTIVKWFDGATVELAPPVFRTGFLEAAASTVAITSWEIMDDLVSDLQSVLRVIAPEYFGESDTAGASAGFSYIREQRDEATADDLVPGAMSFVHLEKLRHFDDGAKTNITTFVAPNITGQKVELPFDPEESGNIFAEAGDVLPAADTEWAGGVTFLRILHGLNAGIYRVLKTEVAAVSGADAVDVQNLDGSTPAFSVETNISCCLYNARMAVASNALAGPAAASGIFRTVALSLFEDGHASGAAKVGALRVGWRGDGAGILATLNDATYRAYANGTAAEGPLVRAKIFSPATGIYLTVGTAETATDVQRGYGFRIVSETEYHSWDNQDPGAGGAVFTDDDGASYGGLITQTGEDPALVLVKMTGEDPEDATSSYSRLSPSAALVVGRATKNNPATIGNRVATSGQGSAIETAGSVYVLRKYNLADTASAPGWAEGGVFVEDTVGAGRWMYPMVGGYNFLVGNSGEGESPFTGWDSPTRLGNPGILVPAGAADADPSAELYEPAFGTFNLRHQGMLEINTGTVTDVTEPFNRLVGCRVRITESGHAFEDEEYAIVAVKSIDAAKVLLALYGPELITGVEEGTVEFQIRGQRWHQAHLGIGDYMLIGTHDAALGPSSLPLMTYDPDVVSDRLASAPLSGNMPTFPLLSPVSWGAASDGTGLGNVKDVTTLTDLYVIEADFETAAGWKSDSTAEQPRYEHGAMETYDARPPFSNVYAKAGTLRLYDFYFEELSGSMTLEWSKAWSGSLHIAGDEGAQCRVWQRGRTYLSKGHLSVTVKIRAALQGTAGSAAVVALRDDSGTLLASSSFNFVANEVPGDYEVTLSIGSPYGKAADYLAANKESEALYVTLDYTSFAAHDLYILEFRSEPATLPQVVSGPQIVQGTALAHGFRFTDPIRGFQTIHPASVSMLGGLDYARNESWPTNGITSWARKDATGTQELRCGPGLVRGTSLAKYLEWEADLATAGAALGGSLDDWLNELDAEINDFNSSMDTPSYAEDIVEGTGNLEWHIAAALAEAVWDDKLDIVSNEVLPRAWQLHAAVLEVNQGPHTSNDTEYENAISAVLADSSSHLTFSEEYLAIASAEPYTGWIRPFVDQYRFFSKGVNSASLTFANNAFDPLWYAYQAELIHNNYGTSGEDVQVDAFVPCGMTGFIVPLDPPHGSILLALAVGLSFRAFNEHEWGIWRDMTDRLRDIPTGNDEGFNDLQNPEEWDLLAGCKVEIWRHNAIDFDVAEGDFAAFSQHLPEHGFGELILSYDIDLSEETIPQDSANFVTNSWTEGPSDQATAYVGQEFFKKSRWDLAAATGDPESGSRLKVDRRHYSYTLVIRCFGGARTSQGKPLERGNSYQAGADSRWQIPQAIGRWRGTLDADDKPEACPEAIYGYYETGVHSVSTSYPTNPTYGGIGFPPQIKFRGARLEYLTDRAGDGGWGS